MKIGILRDYDIVVVSCVLPDGFIIGGAQSQSRYLLGIWVAGLTMPPAFDRRGSDPAEASRQLV